MLKRFVVLLLCLLLLAGCDQPIKSGELEKVGLLVPETINDQVWGTKGYKGMLKIQSHFNVDVYYKEDMNSEMIVERAVEEFAQKGVNLIFGHGNEYAVYFNHLSEKYPDIHFVSFNGDAQNENTTSLNFEGYAMGFFGGMVASHMSKTKRVGIIAAYEWQPEVEGFYEGALFEDNEVKVEIEYVGHWDDDQGAILYLDKMIDEGADVIYPAGDGYNVPIIEKVKEHGLYAIGYISDQADLGETTVLTSTVQHVDKLYEVVAEEFDNGKLKAGNLYYDFSDDVITLGEFSSDVDKEFENEIHKHIEVYRETGKLPNE
ncbi:BMP family ABC transporter substrate-binding protein [Bacillus canaveralius]|uniref:BMP family ABC transporter substrate-binding protein n=1 Tax=Bacillus canaveralius TaxID=1403243 RepID=A0A2N5GKI1_9BACI|nr:MULTISPECIES: BMP family ABC transporter substrate-binding protein [Bacillus]PLR82012.1 BMP family ABC transporter substrate-binding protein [Bacillus canaveralius]PLR83322.1 BMP family ABC transporter substrate-binding protein [Bacillus sp. V33-4]PLR99398.1 BMP family ABC transporter substrate-binding protein [Bacillus canaveralius]RSK56014.1 BMP family ABC transporter substrate-binding protein [Bacillus canaveralius]